MRRKNLYYGKFTEGGFSGTKVSSNGGLADGYLSRNHALDTVQWKNFPYNSGSTVGLSNHGQNLFDGIACQDGQLATKLNG